MIKKQITELLLKGYSNKEIAESLNISIHTVTTYLYYMYQNVGAKNRVQYINKIKEGIKK